LAINEELKRRLRRAAPPDVPVRLILRCRHQSSSPRAEGHAFGEPSLRDGREDHSRAMLVASGFDHLAGRTPQGLPDVVPIIKESTWRWGRRPAWRSLPDRRDDQNL